MLSSDEALDSETGEERAAYLPDPLQDERGEGGHPWRTSGKLHQHGEQLEEGVSRLRDTGHSVRTRDTPYLSLYWINRTRY